MKLQRDVFKKIEVCLCKHGPNYARSIASEPGRWRKMVAYVHELPGAHLGTATQSCALIFEGTV